MSRAGSCLRRSAPTCRAVPTWQAPRHQEAGMGPAVLLLVIPPDPILVATPAPSDSSSPISSTDPTLPCPSRSSLEDLLGVSSPSPASAAESETCGREQGWVVFAGR